MSTYVHVTISPIGDESPPKGVIYKGQPGARTVVAVQFGDDLSLNLGNHHDPERYLRDLAVNLEFLADEVEHSGLAGGAA